MISLLNSYSLVDILTIIVALGVGIKGVITFWDWAVDRLRKAFSQDTEKENAQKEIQEHQRKVDQKINQLFENQDQNYQKIEEIVKYIELLIASDKDAIKSFITREHHYFCYQKKWIDSYSLDCLERRYTHYVAEHGNSFIGDLMEDLRNLPVKDPREN